MYERNATMPPPPAPQERPTLDILVLLAALVRRRRWIYGTTAVALLLALLVGQFAPPRYTSNLQVIIDPNELRVIDNVIRTPNLYSDSLIAQIESQVRVLLSDNVARRVIRELDLTNDPEFVGEKGPGVFQMLSGGLLGKDAAAGDPMREALENFGKRVSARRAERTYMVDVRVWTRDPEKSARIANALVAAFMDELASSRAESARRASESLADRLNELKARVIAAEERVEAYKRANGITTTSGQLVNESQVAELSSQLVQARARTEEMRARYEEIARLQRAGTDAGAIAEAVQSPTVAALRTQLAEATRREAELATTLGSRHPQVSEARAQVRNLRAMIVEELRRIADAARNDYARAQKHERALAANLETLRNELAGTNEAVVRLRELMRDVQASRTVYEAFMVRTREVSEQERLDTTNVRVISPAAPPRSRSFPPRTLLLLLAGLVLGVGLGAVLALLREWLSVLGPLPRRDGGIAPPIPTQTIALVPTPTAEMQDAHEKIARLARNVVGEPQPVRSSL